MKFKFGDTRRDLAMARHSARRGLLLWLVLCIAMVRCAQGVQYHGKINTIDAWRFVWRFVFEKTKSETEAPSIVLKVKFHSRTRLLLQAFQNHAVGYAEEMDLASGKVSEDIRLYTWSEIYTSGKTCQWRDLQARRFNNSYKVV